MAQEDRVQRGCRFRSVRCWRRGRSGASKRSVLVAEQVQ